jgi:endonuclease-3
VNPARAKIARPKTAAERKQRFAEILRRLDQMYPNVTCALTHRNPWELLVATILSAQCTDKRVNEVTPGLFAKYPTIMDFAAVRPEALAQDIRSTGFFNNKAKSIVGAAKKVLTEFGGKVPKTIEELLTVPGAARKTANVVLGTAYSIASGIVVDTHVTRVSRRLDLTKQTDPVKIERDLVKIIPQESGFSIRTRSSIMVGRCAWPAIRAVSIAASNRSATPRTKQYEDRYPGVPLTLDGASLLHQMFRVRWTAWKALSEARRGEILEEATRVLTGMEQSQSALFSLLGHKGDVMMLHFRNSFEELNQAELCVAQLQLNEYLEPTTSYLSVVELGLYESTVRLYTSLTEQGVMPGSPEWEKASEEALEPQRKAMAAASLAGDSAPALLLLLPNGQENAARARTGTRFPSSSASASCTSTV